MQRPAVSLAPPVRSARTKKQRACGKRRQLVRVVLLSAGAHAVLLAFLGWFIVSERFAAPEASFEVAAAPAIRPDPKQHRLDMARHAALAPRPVVREALASRRPLDTALPETLGRMDLEQLAPDLSALLPGRMGALASAALAGASIEGLAGREGKGDGEGFSFFNIRDTAGSVLVMIDVSASMFGRTGDYDYASRRLVRTGTEQRFQRIREEAFALIDSLSVHTRFGVVHWSGSARSWREVLVPATASHKEEARRHIQEEVDYNKAPPRDGRPGGTRHDYALQEAFRLQPEVVFLLTDGNATRSLGEGKFEVIENRELFDLVEAARKELPAVPRLHTIYYVTGQDRDEEEDLLRGLSRRTDGQFRKVRADER